MMFFFALLLLFGALAQDGSGSQTLAPTVDSALIRIACGSTVTVNDGGVYLSDRGFSAGNTATFCTTTTTISPRRRCSRWLGSTTTDLVYTFQVPAGNYQVILEFLEIWSGITAAGQRVFNAIVNGQAINNIDPFRIGGGLNKDAFQTFNSVSASNGVITITLKRSVQNPSINGIVIIPLSGGGGGNAPVFQSTPPTIKAIPFGTWTYNPSASGATSWALTTSSVSSVVTVNPTTGQTQLRPTNAQAGKTVSFGLNACNAKGCTTQNLNVACDDAFIRVHLGGTSNFISSDGLTWRADTNSSFGLVTTNPSANPGNFPAQLVRTQRFAPPPQELVYRFTAPATGSYIVEIVGCETWSGAFAAGRRVFNINVQGVRAFSNVDWFARGGTSAVTLQVGVTITSTSIPIVIQTSRITENPLIATISIRSGSAPPPPSTCSAPFVKDSSGNCVSNSNGCSAFNNQWDCSRGCVDISKGGVYNMCQGGTCLNGACVPHSLTSTDVTRLRSIVENFLTGVESRELATANLVGLQPGDDAGAMVRLSFHSVSTRVAEACIMVPCTNCEFDNPHNNGLQNIVNALRNLYNSNNLWSVITMTDWTYLAVNQAVVHASKGQINPTYLWGRTQCRCMTTVPVSACAGGLVNTAPTAMPDAENTLAQIQAIMENGAGGGMGFTGEEWRCLLGAHALGRAMPNNTGYARHWTNNPNVLDNGYAVTLNDPTLPWTPESGTATPGFTSPSSGKTQYSITGQPGQGRMMLKADVRAFWSADGANDNCVITHGGGGCLQLPELSLLNTWANSASAWFTCFRAAFEKLTNLRQNNLKAPV